ncbi:type II toxin-antitoxin system RnlB family antitoxin [Clostridium sp. ZS2-4]|uniref:type II toxin-antitoxin system RnlB family antitoxin n=1 Tax=Clostridium sp. ZS2-4 TaxID=2987703 RepID=UPI00227A799D|nr:type II toxin-antitoxin system RnlB family antitoxin [Clostridium sp. ZS2-4]MCY6355181.1 type II toxin-antitoxin system RnlB family antitoxin [Clostridium sp. ZS2-4]
MGKYEIIEINHNQYEFIIFSESYETPLLYLDEICDELKNYNVHKCKVIFDMLLNMGNTSERYAEVIFDGGKFINATFQYIKIDRRDKLRKKAIEILKEKPYILEDSILNSVQKKMINKGIVI